MPTLLPVYSGPSSLLTDASTLQGLPINTAVYCGPIDLSAAKAIDVIIGVELSCAAANTHRIDIGVLASPDGAVWSGLSLANLQNNVRTILHPGVHPLVSLRPGSPVSWAGSLSRALGTLPEFFAICIYNATDTAFAAAYNHRVTANFVNYEYV